jgi:hypothetical protein
LVPPEAAFAPFEELAQDGLASVAKSAEFLFFGAAGSGLCAFEELAQDGLASVAKSAEFLFFGARRKRPLGL